MKKRNLVLGTLIIASALFSTGCTGKLTPCKMGDKMFSKYDTNKDGFVNKKEITNTRFGKIFPDMVENFFKKYDLDKNGVVSKAEIISNAKDEFIKSDKN